MNTTLPTDSEDALEDISFLARSANRVRLLVALAAEPATRRELRETTEVPRATLARIVTELEEQGWVERGAGGAHDLTPTGRHVVGQFLPFLRSMTAIRRLGETVEWLPTDELDVDLRHFADATVVRPANDDPVEVVDDFATAVEGAAEFRGLTHYAPPDAIARAILEGLESGRLDVTVVMTDEVVTYLQGRPERRTQFRAWLDAGAALYQHDADLPCNVWTIDETVFVKKSGDDARERSYGVPIVSRNPKIHEWATDVIDAHRDAAVPVGNEAFAETATDKGVFEES